MRSSDKRKGRKTSPLREVFSFEGDEALIERIKYRFGTTRSGRRIHILYRLAGNAYTALCRANDEIGQVNKSLTIHDVDCQFCRKTFTYFRLLPKGKSKDTITRFSASIQTITPENTIAVKPEPGGVRACLPKKPRERPQLKFDSSKEIRCVFLTLVVRVDSLRKKYKEGIGKFLKRHGARCNRELAYLCTMGGEDLDEPIMDLQRNGFAIGEDFICFDAAMKLLGMELTKGFNKRRSEDIRFPVEWLAGRVQKGAVVVSFTGKLQEARKQ